MNRSNDIDVKLNVTGIDLDESDIPLVLEIQNSSGTHKRRWLANHFDVKENELSAAWLIRYVEADKKMTRISLGSNHEDIHSRLIYTLLSAKRCYSYGEYRACIEMCALHGEMLANYLCITDKIDLCAVLNNLSSDDNEKIIENGTSDIYFSDNLNQLLRLRWLVKAGIITPEDKTNLQKVHLLRIKYFHRWTTQFENEKDEALDAFTRLSSVSAKYLELMGGEAGTFNQANMDRIRRYMQIVT